VSAMTPTSAPGNDAPLWAELVNIIDRLFGAIDREDALVESLDALVELLHADRGLLTVTDPDGAFYTVTGRKNRQPLGANEQQEISRTILREATQRREVVVWDPLAGAGASASMTGLKIAFALAAPLFGTAPAGAAQRPVIGVLYLDVRDPLHKLTERHLSFFTATAQLLSGVIEEQKRLSGAREDLREVRARSNADLNAPSLDEILAPPSMLAIRSEVESALESNVPIFILGESGCGKTLLASALAEASARRPVVRAVLGMSDELNTITSELFGHERGAYSGALAKRTGLVELADNGTLIFDEVLNLTPNAQKLVLDFTQFGTYRPLGYDRADPKRSTVRLLAATNGDLDAAMASGRFREDLYYRLAGVTLRLPPLRERRQDIPTLAEQKLKRIDPTRTLNLSVELRRALVADVLRWPGNVRQLERMIERARERALLRDPRVTQLGPEHLDPQELQRMRGTPAAEKGEEPQPHKAIASWQALQEERKRVQVVEQQLIQRALDQANGVVSRAARTLGVPRSTLVSRMELLGIGRPESNTSDSLDG
jgi:transcriptional regulator with GAF, ATPase, and Fis domain